MQGKLRPQRPLRAAITVLQPETQVERVGIRAVYSVQCRYQTVKFPVGGCGKCHLQFGIRAGGGINAATPVIAVTADTSPEDVAACMDAGMTYFVSKPLTPPALLSALQHVLSGATEDAELAAATA